MAKHSSANILPRKVINTLGIVGQQIQLARKRRGLTIASVSERAQCSELTVIRVEKGAPTVSIGIYARILYGLGLDDDLLKLAQDDPVGNILVNSKLLRKNSKSKDTYDFD